MGIFTEQLSGRYQAAKMAISAIEGPLSELVQTLGATFSCNIDTNSVWVHIHPESSLDMDRAVKSLEAAFPYDSERVERCESDHADPFTWDLAKLRIQRSTHEMPICVTVFAKL